MYLEHFGLQRPPFKITPDTSMFYSGNNRGAALEALKYAIASGEGIIKVVGEVGAGKTMLCRMLEIKLGDDIEVVYIANPSLSPENILHVIAFELKLNITSNSSKLEVMQALQSYLLEKHADNKQVVVFVEEAQSMPIETLEEIRLLSNLETNDDKLLQMVLFGQPELDEKLRMPAIRQLKERITQNFYLDPFPPKDVYKYLNFRMRAVGYRGPDLFSPKMANNIERKSNGLTRRINILADKSLLAAFADGGHDITAKHIALAAKDSDFGQNINWQPVAKIISGLSIIAAAIWVGTLIPNVLQNQPQISIPIESSPTVAMNKIESIPEQPQVQVAVQSSVQVLPITLEPKSTPLHEPAFNDLLQLRMQATEQWLQTASNDHFTLQLILLDSWTKKDVQKFIKQAQVHLDINHLYVYKAAIKGRMFYSVLYSEYTERELALNQLQQLPNKLRKSGPYLRTVKGIKADIRKTKSQETR